MPKLCSLAAVLAGAIVCVIGAASQNEKEVSPPAVALLSEFRSDEVRDLVKKHLAALHERDVKRAREAADVFFDLRGGTDLLVQVVEFPNFDVKSHATQLLRQLAKPGDVRLTAGLVPHVRRASDISGGGGGGSDRQAQVYERAFGAAGVFNESGVWPC